MYSGQISNSAKELMPILITEENISQINIDINQIEIKEVTSLDSWLDEAYNMLVSEFDPDVLDNKQTYIDQIIKNIKRTATFPIIIVVAYVRRDNNAYIVGVVDGNVMRLQEGKKTTNEGEAKFFYAISYQVTSKWLRQRNIRGIGKKLLEQSYEVAKRWAKELGGNLLYSVLEAESGSVGFWSKMGYRWPQGITYWQPPLEFDDNGNPRYAEVPEVLMMKSMRDGGIDKINRSILLGIIRVMYQNWCIEKHRPHVLPAILSKIEQCVMQVFERVKNLMPKQDELPLVSRE